MKNNIRFLLIVLLFNVFANLKSQEQKYFLRWRLDEGTVTSFHRELISEISNYERSPDWKKRIKKISYEKVKIKAALDWKIEKKYKKNMFVISLKYRKGKVQIQKNDAVYLFSMENLTSKQKNSPILAPYLDVAQNGFAILFDTKKKKNLVTWKLTRLQNGKYSKQIVRGVKDALGLENTYDELPNKKIPLGYEWNLKGHIRGWYNSTNFKFKQIVKFKGKSLAKVVVLGKIFRNEEEIGTTRGYFLYDYKRGVQVLQDIKQVINQRVVRQERNIEEEIVITQRSKLTKTSASFQ